MSDLANFWDSKENIVKQKRSPSGSEAVAPEPKPEPLGICDTLTGANPHKREPGCLNWRAEPSQSGESRFNDFDDADHPFRKWWEEHGQFMLSGGGRRESIWAARDWIAREQLGFDKEVTGESLSGERAEEFYDKHHGYFVNEPPEVRAKMYEFAEAYLQAAKNHERRGK
jgi:hypothetical protein